MGKGILDTCQVSVLGDCVGISSRTIEGAIQFGHTKLQLPVKLMKISQLVFAYADAEPKIQILLYISPLKKKYFSVTSKFLAVNMFYMYNQKNRS